MSKKVDERVVEMRFDNAQFESGVKTTMSTLDKLKAALKFPSSSKSLDSISNAAKKVDFSGMQKGIETVNARFSAMQVVGMTALSNITSAAMRAGTNLVKSFTIDPIVSGFKEYELQMNSIQTILANTKSKGTTMADVTAALDELNEYADLTIYNFAEMTKNIGTFTAAGVDLDTSVGAIKGIANLGAMSSSTSAQVSTAMYQLSQALATGRVSLMDWNSVVNAGMGGEQFQNALKRTAENFGYDVDGMIKKYGSFRESLTQGGWLTAEVLNETLNQIGGAYDATALKAKGYSDDQIEAILDLADTATKAATEVKTFTQLMDTLKEAAGSGFAKMWQNIFGDFEQAKEFFSGLHEMLEPIVTGPIDAINSVLEGAMGGGESRWGEFTEQLDKAGVSVDTFQKKLSEVASSKGVDLSALIAEYGSLEKAMSSGKITADMVTDALTQLGASTDDVTASTKSLAEWQQVVDDVWLGTYGNIDTGRIEALTAAGWEYAEVQKLVNMTVDGHRLTLEDLSAAQIESMGYTKEQAEALANLADEAKKSGGDINTLINDILAPKRSGRELFLEGLTNILTAIIKPLQAVGDAFGSVFGMNSDELYGVIEAFNTFSKSLIMDGDTVDNLTRTLKGLFAIIHLVATAAGNTFTVAFNIANAILGFFGTNLLEVTAILGDALFSFDQWITSGDLIRTALEGIGAALSWLLGPLGDFLSYASDLLGIGDIVQTIADAFNKLKDGLHSFAVNPSKMFGNIAEYFSNLSWDDVLAGLSNFGSRVGAVFSSIVQKLSTVGPDIIAGLQNGLSGGWDQIISFLTELANRIVEAVKAVLGIHSPSTVFFDIGKNIIEGLVNGIKYLSGKVGETLTAIFEDITGALGTLDWGTILTVGAGVGTFAVFYQLTDALQSFGEAAENLTSPLEAFENFSKSFDKIANAKAFELKAEAIKNIAISVAILAGSLVVLSMVDPAKLWSSVGALTVMGAVLAGIVAVTGHFGKGKQTGGIKEAVTQILDLAKLAGLMISIGASMLMLSGAMKIIGSMSEGEVKQAGIVLAAFAGVVAALIAITKIAGTGDLDAAAKFVGKVGTAFLILAVTARLLGGMSVGEMTSAGIMLAAFTGVVAALIAVTKFGGEYMDYAAKFVTKVGTAFLLLAVTAKIMGGMSPGEMVTAGIMLAAFTGVVAALIAVTKFAGNQVDKLSDFLLKVTAGFVLLGVAAKILGNLTPGEMIQAGVAIGAFVGVMAALVAITNLAPKDQIAQISTTLLAMSASIAILAAVAALLGMVPAENLVKGIAAVAALSVLVGLLVMATKNAKDVKGTMIGIAAAIGVMAASIAVLSLLDPARVVLATACMSAVMGMFALIVKMGSNVQTSLPVMITMVAALGVMAAAIGILAQMPVANVVGSAAALAALMLTLAATLKIVASVSSVATIALVSMAVLTGIMAALGLILGMMTGLGVQNAIPNAIALSTLLIAMSAALKIVATVQSVSVMALAGMVVLGLVLAEIGLVLAMMTALNVQNAIPNAIALSTLLLAMSAAMLILTVVGAGGPAAIIGAASLLAAITAFGAVVAALGALSQQFTQLGSWIDSGTEIMNKIGYALGSFVSSIGEGLTSGLPNIASNLSSFITNLNPFLEGMKGIDPSIGTTIQNLGTGLLALTAGGMLDQLTSFFSGESAIGSIGEQLVPFGQAMAQFAGTLSGVDLGALLIGSQAAKAIADMANSMPKEGGILDSIFGSTVDLGTFGNQLVDFGNGMKKYAESIAGVDVASIQNSIPAAEGLAELANKLPAEGGLMQSIFGTTTDLSSFGDQLVDFGEGLQQYASKVVGLDTEAISASIPAAEALNELALKLPASGGLAQSIFGSEGDLSSFGGQLTTFGQALVDYGNKVAELDTGSIEQSIDATNGVLNVLRSYANAEDIDTGITNANKMKDLGTALGDYGTAIAEVDTSQITSSANSIVNLKSAINSLVEIDTSGVASFQAAIAQLAETNVQGLIDAFNNIDMSSIGSGLMSSLAGGISGSSNLVTTAISGLTSTIETTLSGMGDAFNGAGVSYMLKLTLGIVKGSQGITSTLGSVIQQAASTLNSYYGRFYQAGAYISSGLAAGMQSRLSQIRYAASQMAQEAARATRAAAQVKSPSRVFMKIGDYLGQGLVIGMENEQRAIYNAGYTMGDTAYNGIKSTLGRLSDALASDIDVNPTIRPVLDLSDVKNGANSINGLFDNTVPMSVLGRVNSISRSMNDRIQNGTFNDVVKAVDRLRNGLSEIGGPSYTINGITYDDGTNIANTIGDLTRQIRLERRV